MSWLVTSIANTLNLNDEDDDNDDVTTTPSTSRSAINEEGNPNSSPDQSTPPRGVKEDLSELSQTLTRQFWGVASFLAPPPQIDETSDGSDEVPDGIGIDGIRNDLSEIGGKFRTGISKLSENKTVSEITKIASNWLQFATEDLTVEEYAERGVVGVTDEVVAFAKDVSLHPETWLDFPLPDDDSDLDFDLSDAQQEHALAVERLSPELRALRTELCLSYMSEATFWKIYFVLVHPRLSRHDAEILSTPEIVKAREMLAHELHTRTKPKSYEPGTINALAEGTSLSREEHLSVPVIDPSESVPVEISASEPVSSNESDLQVDKHLVTSTDIPVHDKTILKEAPIKQANMEKVTPGTSSRIEHENEEDADEWLKEDNTGGGGALKGSSFSAENDDEDISFSDLEEDEEVPMSDKLINDTSKNKGSSEWLDIEDIDDA